MSLIWDQVKRSGGEELDRASTDDSFEKFALKGNRQMGQRLP